MELSVKLGTHGSKQTATATTGVGIQTKGWKSYQCTVVGTGSVSATANVEVSNDNSNWVILGIISLSGTTSATDGFASEAPWGYVRMNVTAISGTGATVTLLVGA